MQERNKQTIDAIIASMKKLNYDVFTNDYKDYNLNIVGVRRAVDTNVFDDSLYVFWKHNGVWSLREYIITTDAGRYYLLHPMSNVGTAILCEGQYSGAYVIDKHLGKYDALCQAKPVLVYRDRDRDTKHDMIPEQLQKGVFGINIHCSGINSLTVDNWSAGCQVFQNKKSFNEFMSLCYAARDVYGNSFTYTLLNINQLPDGF